MPLRMVDRTYDACVVPLGWREEKPDSGACSASPVGQRADPFRPAIRTTGPGNAASGCHPDLRGEIPRRESVTSTARVTSAQVCAHSRKFEQVIRSGLKKWMRRYCSRCVRDAGESRFDSQGGYRNTAVSAWECRTGHSHVLAALGRKQVIGQPRERVGLWCGDRCQHRSHCRNRRRRRYLLRCCTEVRAAGCAHLTRCNVRPRSPRDESVTDNACVHIQTLSVCRSSRKAAAVTL